MDGEQDRDQQGCKRQCEDAAVPEVARLPQSSEATSDKQDDDQQAGNAEPDVSHGSIPGREDSSTFGNLKSIVQEGELVTSNLTFALVVARRV